MIKIKTTPNLYGISLIGDYQDLYELWESIGNYLQVFIDNNDDYPYHEYEFLLSLNYDIRHAYMGSRGVSIEENNAAAVGEIAQAIFEIPEAAKKEFQTIRTDFKKGNLYFQVEILYPLVFHYMIALGLILDEYYLPKWFENEKMVMQSYDILDAEHDRAIIQHFVSLLWNNVRELFGAETALSLFKYYENSELYYLPNLYTTALLHCQLANFENMNQEQKKQFLLLSMYELMDSSLLNEEPESDLESYERYQKAFANIEKKGQKFFPIKEEFYTFLEKEFPANKPLYEEDYEAFLTKTYGIAPDDEPNW